MDGIESGTNSSLRKLITIGGGALDDTVFRERAQRYKVSGEELDILTLYYRLIVGTDYLRSEAYDFFINGKTYNEIIEEYGVSAGYVRNIIYNETRRVFNDIGGDPLYDIVKGKSHEGLLVAYNRTLGDLLGESTLRSGKTVQGLFTFDIEGLSVIDRGFNQNVEENEFKDLAGVMRYFVKDYQNVVLNSIDARHIGYIYYLLRTDDSSLTERDRERKKYLIMEWMLNVN